MTQEEQQLRSDFLRDKARIVSDIMSYEQIINHATRDIMDARKHIEELETQMHQTLHKYISDLQALREYGETTAQWHPRSDIPEDKDAYYLARTKDGLPFLIHFIGKDWLPQVHEWKSI